MSVSIYDYTLPGPDGSQFSLGECRGKVIHVVNTAAGCGFTPHYQPCEKL